MKLIKEHINFQRNIDPKEAMNTGWYEDAANELRQFMFILRKNVSQSNACTPEEFPWNFFILKDHKGFCYKYGDDKWYFKFFEIEQMYFDIKKPEGATVFSRQFLDKMLDQNVHFDEWSLSIFDEHVQKNLTKN